MMNRLFSPFRSGIKSINIKHLPILIFIVLQLISVSFNATVQLQSTYTTLNTGKQSTYTFSINRNVSITGATIVPSVLSSSFVVQVVFGDNYGLSSGVVSAGSHQGSSITQGNKTIQLFYTTNNNTALTFSFTNIINPYITSIQQTILIKIKNSTLTVVDQAELALTYTSFQFTQMSTWAHQFVPSTISTTANFTFTLVPDVWKNSSMNLVLGFNKYWTRSLSNLTSTTTFSTSSKCQPTCTITTKGSFIQVVFVNLTLQSNGSRFLKIINIRSPPTLQPIDIISISSVQNLFSSTLQTGSLTAISTQPNNLQSITATTTNKISQIISLSLQLSTNNIFGPNDTITLTFQQQFLSNVSVTLTNGIVSSYSTDISTSTNQIQFNNFLVLSSTYSKMTFDVTLVGGLKALRSSKMVQNNKVQIKRNGYLYNEGLFSLGVGAVLYGKVLAVSVSNQFANFNSTLSLGPIVLTSEILSSDTIVIKIPDSIKVYSSSSSSCIPISCIGCICTIIAADSSTGIVTSSLTITNFPSTSKPSFSLNLQIKNPITSGQSLQLCQYDSTLALIECSNGTFPSIAESILDSNAITFTNSNDFVYEITNYTILINLTNYDLTEGYLMVYFVQGLFVMVDNTSSVCTVNSQPVCNLTQSTNSRIIIRFNITNTTKKTYEVKLNNIRNPKSTQSFQFMIEIFEKQNAVTGVANLYYSIASQFYRVSNPYALSSSSVSSSHSPCINSETATLTINLTNLPFDPSPAILIDNPSPSISSTTTLTKTIGQQISFNPSSGTSSMDISIQNHYSLQPATYSFLLKTSNLLYDIYSLSIIVKNCQANLLSINSWSINGLLGNQGEMNIVFNSALLLYNNTFDYLRVQFPSQFNANISIISDGLSTTKLSPRTFAISLEKILPYKVKIWNFTNIAVVSDNVKVSTYSKGADGISDYLVSQNVDTVKYQLSSITICVFPCKLCSTVNVSICLQCYSINYTEKYLLADGQCVSSCPLAYFLQSNTSCISCPAQCSQCTSLTNCTACLPNFYLLNGSCLTDCPQKYYPITVDQKCQSCSFPCLNCVNSTTCTSCQPLYYLSSSSTCVLNCLTTEYPISNVCRSCQTPCLSCSVGLTNCTSCPSGYYLTNNQCVSICPSPLVPATTTNVCTSCILPCSTCTISPTICTSCQSPYKLQTTTSTCITKCLTGFYQLSNACIECPDQCSTCSSQSNCTVCANGYTLYDQKCLTLCPSNHYTQTLLTPSNPITNNSKVCTQCSNNCFICQNQSYCSYCQSNYVLKEGVCLSNCPITMYSDSFQCLNCSASCLYCSDASICTVCSKTSNLYEDTCVLTCPTDTVAVSEELTVSLLPSLNTIQQNTTVCQKCSKTLSNCIQCISPIICKKCVLTYTLSAINHTCQSSCSLGYINLNSSGYCIQCDSQCVSCTGLLNNCTLCVSGYSMSVNASSGLRECLSNCLLGMVEYLGNCVACKAPCATCIQSTTKCLTCITSNTPAYILFNSTCLTTCPTKYYQFQFTCQPCNTSCQQCNKYGCLLCQFGYFQSLPYEQTQQSLTLTYYQCYQQCPSHIPFIIDNVCSQCNRNCLSCNDIECLYCKTDYLIYGEVCTVECPPPLMPYSSRCVDPKDIPTPQQVPQQDIGFLMPIPFTIAAVVLALVCFLGKLQYQQTILSLSVYAIGCMVCIISNVFYFAIFISTQTSVLVFEQQFSTSQILLLLSLVINYTLNILFIALLKYTLFNDIAFQAFFISHKQNIFIVLLFGGLTSHTNYVMLFSKLFGFGMLKAYLENLYNLRILNYLWIGQIVVYFLALVAGTLKLTLTDQQQFTLQESTRLLYQCLDLILLNLIMFVLCLITFKKHREIYLRQQDIMSTQSTKKVIFDESEDNQHRSYDSIDQFNIKGKNFRIANEDLEGGLLPEETEGKYSQQVSENQHNYDAIFVANGSYLKGSNHKLYDQEEGNVMNMPTRTNLEAQESSVTAFADLDSQPPTKRVMALQSSIQVSITKEDMVEKLQNMKEVGGDQQQNEQQQQYLEQQIQQMKQSQQQQQQQDRQNQQHQSSVQQDNQYNKQKDQQNNIPNQEERSLQLTSINQEQNNQIAIRAAIEKQTNHSQIQQHHMEPSEEDNVQTGGQLTLNHKQFKSGNDDSKEHQLSQNDKEVDDGLQSKQHQEKHVQRQSLDNDKFSNGLLTHTLSEENLQSKPIQVSKSMLINNARRSPPKYPRNNSLLAASKSNSVKSGRSISNNKNKQAQQQVAQRVVPKTSQGPRVRKQQRYKKNNLNSKGIKATDNQSHQFIPPYLFASKYHAPKGQKPQARISGVDKLFQRRSTSTNPKMNTFQEEKIDFSDGQLSFVDSHKERKSLESPKKSSKNRQILTPQEKMAQIFEAQDQQYLEEIQQSKLKSYLGQTFRQSEKQKSLKRLTMGRNSQSLSPRLESSRLSHKMHSPPKKKQPSIEKNKSQKHIQKSNVLPIKRTINTEKDQPIDFALSKNKTGKRQQISNLLSQIQRKQKIQTKSKQLNHIYKNARN